MTPAEQVARAQELLGPKAATEVSLAPLSTYRVGGSAALLVTADNPADLELCGSAVAETGIRVLVVGNGSNLLVADAGFDGLAVRLGDRFRSVSVEGTTVRAGGAALLPVVARQSVTSGLTGFEWAVGVPGSIGGAVRMNAGGHGSDMAACVQGVRVFDAATGENYAMAARALDFAYRRSNLRSTQVVTEATLTLSRLAEGGGDVDGDPVGAALISEIVRWRRENQPGGQNAGSVFTNPPGDSAGRLVDIAGCKGLRHGTAEVSAKHGNFIQADAGGSADDVFALMGEVRSIVEERTGVRLHPETVLVGFDDATTETEAAE